MSMYPNYIFAASQAQQYAWMKEYYPTLWTSLKKAVSDGRFVPTGGTWIEMVIVVLLLCFIIDLIFFYEFEDII